MEQANGTTLKVMTYNLQWFAGINGQLEMQKKIIDRHKPDIIGLQELTKDGKICSAGRAMLAGYPYLYLSKHKNYIGIASKYALTNVKAKDFRHQDRQDKAKYGETRAYIRSRLKMYGKTITIINTHLCLTQEVKFKQMREIFRIAQRHRYCIILGDFNCFMSQPGDAEYNGLYKQFADAGYRLADCGEKITKTWTDKAKARYLSQFTWPCDNIIVSGSIELKKAEFDKTKLSYENGDMIDHIPVVATLLIG